MGEEEHALSATQIHLTKSKFMDRLPTIKACRTELVAINRRFEALDETMEQEKAARAPDPDVPRPGSETEKSAERRQFQNRVAVRSFRTNVRLRDLERLVTDEIWNAFEEVRNVVLVPLLELGREAGKKTAVDANEDPASGWFSSLLLKLPVTVVVGLRSVTTCTWFIITFCIVVLIGTGLSLWWSLWKGDISGGFTLGAFVTGTGCAVVNKLHSRHREDGRCRCNSQPSETGVELGPDPDG